MEFVNQNYSKDP